MQQSVEIDPELNRLALEEAAQQHPEFAEYALRVIARPLLRGFAWQLEWKGAPPPGQQAWEFQNNPGIQEAGENHGIVPDKQTS